MSEKCIGVEWGFNDEPMFETRDGYGFQCPESLWEKYQDALRKVGELQDQIAKWPRRNHPPPGPGDFGYAIWKMYRDMIEDSNRRMNLFFRQDPEPAGVTQAGGEASGKDESAGSGNDG